MVSLVKRMNILTIIELEIMVQRMTLVHVMKLLRMMKRIMKLVRKMRKIKWRE